MRFKFGILDISAVVIVLIAVVIPARETHVESAYARLNPQLHADVPATVTALSRYQSRLLVDPGDGAAADEASQALSQLEQHDQALRIAGEAATNTKSPTAWRALLAVASTHSDRIEIPEAHAFAKQAFASCEASSECPAHEKIRLRIFFEELEAGTDAIAAGADPRTDPEGFRREMSKLHPTTVFRPARVRSDSP